MTKKTRIAHTFGFIIILIGLVIFLQYENKHLVVSRGLGNSGFPFRLFNYPEIVEVTLHYPN